MAKENIVIVGGGGAGVGLARALSAKLDASRYNLILISARSKLVHLLAALRMLVTDEGKLEEKAVIPLDNVFVNGNGTLKVGKVVAVEKASGAGTGGDVVLESGERVPFRYVVLATGSLWEGPLALPDENDALLNWVQEWRTKFKNANDIVIVGAGAVGLELAGELRDVYPTGKKITIVQADSLPLNSTYPDKFRKDVLRRWKERDIKFILGDRIDGQPEPSTELRTANGKTLKADLIVTTRGIRPNTDFLKPLGVLNEIGRVKHLPTLQVESNPDMFVVGDIMAFDEQKQLAKTTGHVGIVVANILSLLSGKPAKKQYTGTFEGIFITNGKAKGAGWLSFLWGPMFGDKIVGSVKSKDLFLSAQRKGLGLAA